MEAAGQLRVTLHGAVIAQHGLGHVVGVHLAHLLGAHVVDGMQAGNLRDGALEGGAFDGKLGIVVGPHQEGVGAFAVFGRLGRHADHQGLDDTDGLLQLRAGFGRQGGFQMGAEEWPGVHLVAAQQDVEGRCGALLEAAQQAGDQAASDGFEGVGEDGHGQQVGFSDGLCEGGGVGGVQGGEVVYGALMVLVAAAADSQGVSAGSIETPDELGRMVDEDKPVTGAVEEVGDEAAPDLAGAPDQDGGRGQGRLLVKGWVYCNGKERFH